MQKKFQVYPMKSLQFNRAFTLIELLVVIAIVGILSGFIFVSMTNAINSAKDAKRKFDISQLAKAVMIYEVNHSAFPIEDCRIGDNCSSQVLAMLGSSASLRDPANTFYRYSSEDGTTYTITAELSNDDNYVFDSTTDTYSVVPSSSLFVGACGSANSQVFPVAPSANLCSAGDASVVAGVGPWTWTCTGTTGSPASCSAIYDCVSGGGLTCTRSTDGIFFINKYTLSGATTGNFTWTPPTGVTQVEYLIVGGGGGAGGTSGINYSGGGGAGGYQHNAAFTVSSQTYSISVGAGGVGGGTANTNGSNGANSSFSTITALGGGGGGAGRGTGQAGGNGNAGGSGGGGGAGYLSNGTGGAGSQGGNGGSGTVSGGGGGAGGNGASPTAGIGISNSITGAPVTYSIGGGGQTGTTGAGYGGGGGGNFPTGGLSGNAGVVIIRHLRP